MQKVVITTDSGMCPIDESNMISGQIIDDLGNSYRDIKEISSREIIESGKIFRTSSPLMGDYEDKFVECLEEKKDVIHLSMSSGISEGSFNSANLMANMLKDEYENKIYVIDSLTGATGGTLLNEVATNLARLSLSSEDIVDVLNKLKKRLETSFYVPNPTGFIRSGRNKSESCIKEKALLIGLKTALKAGLKFRVDINEEGNLYTKRILQGGTSNEIFKLVKTIINNDNKELYDPNYIVVGNLLQEKLDMEKLRSYIRNLNYFKNIIDKDINGVVATYGCADLCGISLVKKK